MSAVLNALNLPMELGQVVLKFGVSKYIESAGSDAASRTARAQSVKALATQLDGVALGTTTIAQFLSSTAAELEAKQVNVSSQILVTGLLGIVTSALPALPTGNWITAANGAIADTFLKDVEAVCTLFGA